MLWKLAFFCGQTKSSTRASSQQQHNNGLPESHANLSNNLVCEDGLKIVAFCFVVTFYYGYCLEWWLGWWKWKKNRNYGDNSLNDLQRRHVKQYITCLLLFLPSKSLYKHAACMHACISLLKAFKCLICRTDGKMNFVASVCQLFVRVFIALYCWIFLFYLVLCDFLFEWLFQAKCFCPKRVQNDGAKLSSNRTIEQQRISSFFLWSSFILYFTSYICVYMVREYYFLKSF